MLTIGGHYENPSQTGKAFTFAYSAPGNPISQLVETQQFLIPPDVERRLLVSLAKEGRTLYLLAEKAILTLNLDKMDGWKRLNQ